jgi:hypothetical protein
MQKLDWELILKLLGVVFTAVGGVYQWRNLRFRSRLKDDLEILRLYGTFGADNPNYKALKSHIDKTITKAYPPIDQSSKKVNRVDVFLVVLNYLFFILWIYLIIQNGITWWLIVLALFNGFTGSVGLWDVLNERIKK